MSEPLLMALNSLNQMPPRDLMKRVTALAMAEDLEPPVEADVVAKLTAPDQNSPARLAFTLALGRWDSEQGAGWAGGTPAKSADRRRAIYDLLRLSPEARAAVDVAYPRDPAAIIIEDRPGDWTSWLTPQRAQAQHFYWDAYRSVLIGNGWDPHAIAKLDTATYDIVRRLADPSQESPYQAKGLTVGYVQSGKTANFTGVLAKAMDAGYRLVIVLTGTLEHLRRQTQRRLDMELIGVENILGGRDEKDIAQMEQTDYWGDADWEAGRFLRHGVAIHDRTDIPGIIRLSSYEGDYKSLKQGLHALDFRGHGQLHDPRKPLYDSANLFQSSVRIAVVKKNSTVLRKLVADLSNIHARLAEIPTLIIDDEADQASVNTRKPKPTEKKERTAINECISDLLTKLPRAQYIGYTATPFANVFVDPDDSEDIFPKDFIAALERPEAYMGAREFHDLDTEVPRSERTVQNSNEKRFVRDLYPLEEDRAEQERLRALDSYVLAGAIKLYRQAVTGAHFRHHTMLVHQSVKQAEHREARDAFLESWRRAAYSSPSAVMRLRELYERDHKEVHNALVTDGYPETELPLPTSFDTLVDDGHLSKAVAKIEDGQTPILIVNGEKEKDFEQDALDFEKDDVWKILVGGAKLSRGFTVEGLTVSFYTRRVQAADTLMQMGRWFGFRRGYRDLIRLFIAREVEGPRNTTVDMYEAFEAIVRDEEDFRAELRQFSEVDEDSGLPMVSPADVPPLVFQRLPWLLPTQTNKMYNRRLVSRGAGGRLVDFTYLPKRGAGRANRAHMNLMQPVFERLDNTSRFTDSVPTPVAGGQLEFEGRHGLVPVEQIISILEQFTWSENWSIEADLTFLKELQNKGRVTGFTALLAKPSDVPLRDVEGLGKLPLVKRRRREDRPGFSGSSKRQRPAVETIAGRRLDAPAGTESERDLSGGPAASALYQPDQGALLITLVYDPATDDNDQRDPRRLPEDAVVPLEDVAVLLSWALPYDAAPHAKIGFQAIKSGGPIVTRADATTTTSD